MIEQTLRPFYQRVMVQPLVTRLSTKVKPLHITLAALIFGLAFCPALWLGYPWLAIFFLLLSGYCDTLDGTLARHQKSSSEIGSVIDIMADRAVEFSAILGFYWLEPTTRATSTIFLLGSILLCITSFLVVAIFSTNASEKSFHYSPGLIERAETFLFFIVMVLIPQAYIELALLLTGLITITTCIRLYQYAQQSKATQNSEKSAPENQ